jgi:hypothetical protein
LGLWQSNAALAENAIRPFVVGRKGWLFAGSPAGAETSALLYSLVETAKANGLEPHAYLSYLFEHLPTAKTPDAVAALLPAQPQIGRHQAEGGNPVVRRTLTRCTGNTASQSDGSPESTSLWK